MSLLSAIKNIFKKDNEVRVEQDKKDPRLTRVTIPDGMSLDETICHLAKEEPKEEPKFDEYYIEGEGEFPLFLTFLTLVEKEDHDKSGEIISFCINAIMNELLEGGVITEYTEDMYDTMMKCEEPSSQYLGEYIYRTIDTVEGGNDENRMECQIAATYGYYYQTVRDIRSKGEAQ